MDISGEREGAPLRLTFFGEEEEALQITNLPKPSSES